MLTNVGIALLGLGIAAGDRGLDVLEAELHLLVGQAFGSASELQPSELEQEMAKPIVLRLQRVALGAQSVTLRRQGIALRRQHIALRGERVELGHHRQHQVAQRVGLDRQLAGIVATAWHRRESYAATLGGGILRGA